MAIDERWDSLILRITADNPDWTQYQINQYIPEANKKLQNPIEGDPPSARTVDDRVKKLREPKNQHILEAERRVSYPESFGTKDLPWESVPYVLEIMTIYPSLQGGSGHAWALADIMIDQSYLPTTRAAKWYYRLSLAAPYSPQRSRCIMAFFSAFAEITKMPKYKYIYNKNVESWILFKPWRLPNELDDEGRKERIKYYTEDIELTEIKVRNSGWFPEDNPPPTSTELIELGIRPDQFEAHIRHIIESNKVVEERENA